MAARVSAEFGPREVRIAGGSHPAEVFLHMGRACFGVASLDAELCCMLYPTRPTVRFIRHRTISKRVEPTSAHRAMYFPQSQTGRSRMGVSISLCDVNLDILSDAGEPRAILRGITLEIPPGQYVAVVGPSGCGKTSLLRAVAGTLSRFAEGAILSGNISLSQCDQGHSQCLTSLAPQSSSLVPWLTVQQNVLLPIELRLKRATPVHRARVQEILTLLGISAFADALPHTLSGGIAQRASLARALIARSDLLLLDEPLNALDIIERERIQGILRTPGVATGATTLHVTHDLYEAAFVADRILVLSPRPARILDDVTVPPHSRDMAFRTSETYRRTVAQIRASLVADATREDAGEHLAAAN